MPAKSRAGIASPACGERPVDTQKIVLSTSLIASRARRVSLYTTSAKNSSGKPISISSSDSTLGRRRPNSDSTNKKAVGLGQGGIPLGELLHPAGNRAVHAVKAAMPIVVLGKDIVEVRRHLLVILAGQRGESGNAWNAA